MHFRRRRLSIIELIFSLSLMMIVGSFAAMSVVSAVKFFRFKRSCSSVRSLLNAACLISLCEDDFVTIVIDKDNGEYILFLDKNYWLSEKTKSAFGKVVKLRSVDKMSVLLCGKKRSINGRFSLVLPREPSRKIDKRGGGITAIFLSNGDVEEFIPIRG